MEDITEFPKEIRKILKETYWVLKEVNQIPDDIKSLGRLIIILKEGSRAHSLPHVC